MTTATTATMAVARAIRWRRSCWRRFSEAARRRCGATGVVPPSASCAVWALDETPCADVSARGTVRTVVTSAGAAPRRWVRSLGDEASSLPAGPPSLARLPRILSADLEKTDLNTWDARADAAAATPTPISDPVRPIWDERRNDTMAANPLAAIVENETSLRTVCFPSCSSSCVSLSDLRLVKTRHPFCRRPG